MFILVSINIKEKKYSRLEELLDFAINFDKKYKGNAVALARDIERAWNHQEKQRQKGYTSVRSAAAQYLKTLRPNLH